MPRRAFQLFALTAALTGTSSVALANAHDDDMAEALRRIEYATKQITRPPWFDGSRITGNPPYKDRQVEALVKKQAAAELKGAQVFKVGLDYNDWKAYDEKTRVGSDSKYDYYKLSKGKNRYKRGWLLVKLPGQPFCQSREFIAARVLNGPISIESLDGGGYFVKCP
jgi:hypothetical protein